MMSNNDDILSEIKKINSRLENLENQTGINCNKLDTMQSDITDLKTDVAHLKEKIQLPEMYNMVQANGQNIEVNAKSIEEVSNSVRALQN